MSRSDGRASVDIGAVGCDTVHSKSSCKIKLPVMSRVMAVSKEMPLR